MINSHYLQLSLSRTYFHGSEVVGAIKVLYKLLSDSYIVYFIIIFVFYNFIFICMYFILFFKAIKVNTFLHIGH